MVQLVDPTGLLEYREAQALMHGNVYPIQRWTFRSKSDCETIFLVFRAIAEEEGDKLHSVIMQQNPRGLFEIVALWRSERAALHEQIHRQLGDLDLYVTLAQRSRLPANQQPCRGVVGRVSITTN